MVIDGMFRRIEFFSEFGFGVIADIRIVIQVLNVHVLMIHRKENIVIIIRAEKKLRFIDINNRSIVSCSCQIAFPADELYLRFDPCLLGDRTDDILFDTRLTRRVRRSGIIKAHFILSCPTHAWRDDPHIVGQSHFPQIGAVLRE